MPVERLGAFQPHPWQHIDVQLGLDKGASSQALVESHLLICAGRHEHGQGKIFLSHVAILPCVARFPTPAVVCFGPCAGREPPQTGEGVFDADPYIFFSAPAASVATCRHSLHLVRLRVYPGSPVGPPEEPISLVVADHLVLLRIPCERTP